MRNKTYNIFVDTGGTFTDCIAVDNTGKFTKRKVLSSGSIRGTIVKQIDRKTFEIEKTLGLRKDILKGYKFRLLKNTGFLTIVKSFNVQKKEITLEEELPNGFITANLNFELFSGEEAPVLGARLITQTSLNEKLPVNEMRLGSTKGTNALLERKGANVILFVTRGFKDIMKIRYQDRPDIFARNVIKPKTLYEKVIEIDERITASGEILNPLDVKKLRVELKKLKQTE
ncbi:MAG: 5-oxoprolinase, partial [Bacteroidetes bacterium]